MIGAFYQPRMVLADMDLLATLPERELSAGIAEVIKYGLLGDADFLAWLESNMEKLRARDPAALQYAVRCSCEMKAEIVGQDERTRRTRLAQSWSYLWPRHRSRPGLWRMAAW
jgi:3-dehydroquinate synthase